MKERLSVERRVECESSLTAPLAATEGAIKWPTREAGENLSLICIENIKANQVTIEIQSGGQNPREVDTLLIEYQHGTPGNVAGSVGAA